MPWSLKSPAMFVVLACVIGVVTVGGSAHACTLASYRDNGRYVGGDLTTQIAAKADTIQIVIVTARHLVQRTFTQGEWYLSFGNTDVPDGFPEYVDEFVFALGPVETLKIQGDAEHWVYENDLRVAGYDPVVFEASIVEELSHPNSLPSWVFDRPGDRGYAFMGAAEGAGLGLGSCHSPYVLEVGQTLVALRDSIGRLYPARGAFPLEIDVEFSTERRQTERFGMRMQSLIPIDGPNDPFLVRLREALATRSN